MARKSKVSFYDSRNAFFTQYRGKQHKLADGPDDSPDGPNYLAALKAFGELMAYGTIDQAKNHNHVRTIFEAYLDYIHPRHSERTFKIRRNFLQVFCSHRAAGKELGDLQVQEVKPFHVEDVITEMKKPHRVGRVMKTWNNTTAGMFIASLSAAFNWGIRQELITKNPVAKMGRPTGKSKARERIITPEEYQLLLAGLTHAYSHAIRNLSVGLENSGARPGELCNATVADWNDELGAIIYYGEDKRREDEFRHKTAYKDKDRTIRFTGEALEMVRGLVKGKKQEKRLIFPNRHGKQYSPAVVAACFQKIRERLNMPHLVAYVFRHTLATKWLLAGESIDVLAEILGNTPETIRKHYSHICKDHGSIRAKLEAFRSASVL